MKEIKNYKANKYIKDNYVHIENNIYKYIKDDCEIYVTSLSFIQEDELGEGDSPSNISQYPLEDILNEFNCYISDFYDEMNRESSEICYLEFASYDLQDIKNLKQIIDKHVYNKEVGHCIELIIE